MKNVLKELQEDSRLVPKDSKLQGIKREDTISYPAQLHFETNGKKIESS